MHRMLVLYPPPKDPDHFRRYYVETHVPLAMKLPGLRAARYAFDVQGIMGQSPYFCVFEAEFDSEQALMQALQSEAGQAVAADVPKYATGGISILHYPLE